MNNLTDKFRPPKTKVCTGCKKDKPLKDFYMNGESRDGRHSKCGDCLRTIGHQKKAKRKEQAKTFFDAKFFTLFLLLSASLSTSLTAFSQESPVDSVYEIIHQRLKEVGRPRSLDVRGLLCNHKKPACICSSGEVVTKDVVKPDTLRAIILVTLSPNGIAHARMGFVVIERYKRPVYLDCRKRALKWPQVGWDFREVDKNYKK